MSQLSRHLTQEELVGWAAFFELKNEQEDKAKDRVQTSRAAQAMRKR